VGVSERRREKRLKKVISKIVKQGNADKIRELHKIIFDMHKEEFREDNIQTLVDYLMKNTIKSFRDDVGGYVSLYKKICKERIEEELTKVERVESEAEVKIIKKTRYEVISG